MMHCEEGHCDLCVNVVGIVIYQALSFICSNFLATLPGHLRLLEVICPNANGFSQVNILKTMLFHMFRKHAK